MLISPYLLVNESIRHNSLKRRRGATAYNSSKNGSAKKRPHREIGGRLSRVIQVAGTVDNAMEFDLMATDDVEKKIGFSNEDVIPIPS
jgi:hypothetical protein